MCFDWRKCYISFLKQLQPALWIFYFVLLLSNDIGLNPGPVRYPCSVCCKPVCRNQFVTFVGYGKQMGYFVWNCPCLFIFKLGGLCLPLASKGLRIAHLNFLSYKDEILELMMLLKLSF